jgi:riboflavin kinase/FMN adenylyltransferase
MQIIEVNFPAVMPIEQLSVKQVMALGDFDGIHLGHQEVIQRALAIARQLSLPASIMTFHPHPRVVLGQSKYEQNLTPLDDKLELFSDMGIEYVYLVNFTLALARITAFEFVEQVLVPMGLHSIVVGFDFTYGHEGKGTPESLCQTGRDRFSVEIIPAFHSDGEKVSSTNIRGYLHEGNVEAANHLLGRAYRICGRVVTGEGRGRTIGFPTANIAPLNDYVIPKKGVYAVRCTVNGERYNAVMNIGTKPTFTENEVNQTLEAHLFNFDQSIYDQEIEVEFMQYLRPERKFASVQQLIEQIQQDAEEAKRLLAEN